MTFHNDRRAYALAGGNVIADCTSMCTSSESKAQLTYQPVLVHERLSIVGIGEIGYDSLFTDISLQFRRLWRPTAGQR